MNSNAKISAEYIQPSVPINSRPIHKLTQEDDCKGHVSAQVNMVVLEEIRREQASGTHVRSDARKYTMHRMPHTAKYIPSPALYSLVIEPAIVAVAPSVPLGAKLAAKPIVGCTMIPYAIQKPPIIRRNVIREIIV